MRIYQTELQAAHAKEMRRQGELGFTMIEIAIAIGVIGFALVAIIGILPAGLDVQKDNREDTLVSQDAPFFMDAIRNGATLNNNLIGNNNAIYSAHGLDFLTNYVQSIRSDLIVNGVTNSTTNWSGFTSGAEIIGLLSAPQNNYGTPGFASNYFNISAVVRALSGPATEQQTGGSTGISSAVAFTYQMEVMITPFNSFSSSYLMGSAATNWSLYLFQNPNNYDINYLNILSNRWLEATPGTTTVYPNLPLAVSPGALQYNLFDVRLRFSWPVLPNGKVGPGRQTYRTLIASPMVISGNFINGVPLCFFQPQTFATAIPNGL